MIRRIARIGLGGFALLAVLGLSSSPAQATNYWKNWPPVRLSIVRYN